MKNIRKISIVAVLATLCVLALSLTASASLIGGEGGFYYQLNDDNTASIEEYHGSAVDLVIPDTVYSYAVTAIAENTFAQNTAIKSVVIPGSITSVGGYSFYGCTGLERAVLPNSAAQIGSAAFYGCTALSEVTIPAAVTKIAGNAFAGCENLTIKGEAGSYAETYAAEHGFAFEDSRVFGDTDGDGAVTSGDALSVLRMSVGLEEYGDGALAVADVDGDNSITSADALEFLRYSVGIQSDERIGKSLQS